MQERQSNMELLRLLCMFGIVLHHFIVHYWVNTSLVTDAHSVALAKTADAICYCAVTVFVLISGYFGIKPSVKSFASFYLQCGFYNGLLYFIGMVLQVGRVGKWMLVDGELWKCFLMPFTHSPWWWFILAYVCLYLLSPILNAAVEQMSRRQFFGALVSLAAVNIYFGFFNDMERMMVNPNGYNVMQLLFIYAIGRFISKYWDCQKYSRWIYAVLFLVPTMVIASINIFISPDVICRYRILDTYPYNHPLVMLGAIGLFLLFTTFQFYNKVINWFAASTLSIYLIHEHIVLCSLWQQIANKWSLVTPPCVRIILLLGGVVLLMLGCMLFDKIRFLLTKPLINIFERCRK